MTWHLNHGLRDLHTEGRVSACMSNLLLRDTAIVPLDVSDSLCSCSRLLALLIDNRDVCSLNGLPRITCQCASSKPFPLHLKNIAINHVQWHDKKHPVDVWQLRKLSYRFHAEKQWHFVDVDRRTYSRRRIYVFSGNSFLLLLRYFITSSSLPTLRTRWTELNQTWPHVRKWVRFVNVFEASPFPTKRAKNHLFWTISQLNDNFNSLSSDWNTMYMFRQVRWKLPRVSCVVLKYHELWSTNGFKLDRSFYPPP